MYVVVCVLFDRVICGYVCVWLCACVSVRVCECIPMCVCVLEKNSVFRRCHRQSARFVVFIRWSCRCCCCFIFNNSPVCIRVNVYLFGFGLFVSWVLNAKTRFVYALVPFGLFWKHRHLLKGTAKRTKNERKEKNPHTKRSEGRRRRRRFFFFVHLFLRVRLFCSVVLSLLLCFTWCVSAATMVAIFLG